MAPSTTSTKISGPSAFENRIAALHTYLLGTLTAHTLKDLEKSLPSAVQGINGMNAKDHIQALVDESLLRVEKIGTGNWYWCFGSEASHQRDRVREQLLSEEATVRARVEALRLELVEEKIKGGGDVTDDELVERCELMSDIEIVKTRIQVLKVDLAAYEDGDPLVLQGKYEQIQEMKDAAEVWTDNCYILEGYMRNQLAMIKEESVGLLRECYGTEFIEEQGGLAELS